MMPNWFTSTLSALPAVLWMIVGVGLPWALAILPRRDWRDRPALFCLILAIGPALITGWMFVLGTIGMDDNSTPADNNPMQTTIPALIGGQKLMTPTNILGGSIGLALIGGALAWRKARRPFNPVGASRPRLLYDEKLLIALIAAATLGRWLITSLLAFGSWDELWVYGYQGRVYFLTGFIPADIGYYPPFLPLQYAYTQIMTGAINDHAARSVLPFMQIGSILAVYLLGAKLFDRRAGLFAAAIWALYPHFGYWTRIGDLEIPQTFTFTAAAAYFLSAWMRAAPDREPPRFRLLRRPGSAEALIAGVYFGIAMWTKPTAGAFILGVIGLLALELGRVAIGSGARSPAQIMACAWPRLRIVMLTGLACIPLGALWYVRNLILGHDLIVFPGPFWMTQAQRSGAELGWPLLGLALLMAYVCLRAARSGPDWRAILIGAVLIAAGVAPSILDPHHMTPVEWSLLAGGVAVIGIALWRLGRTHASMDEMRDVRRIGWAYALILPYFVTWFISYSYHYRLSFPIVPILLLPAAVILARWLSADRVSAGPLPLRRAYAALVIGIALPGIAVSVYDEAAGWGWLPQAYRNGGFGRSSLDSLVDALRVEIDAYGESIVVSAPGAQRLPFYFPTVDIRVADLPTEFDDVEDIFLFIEGSDARFAYRWWQPGAEDGTGSYQNPFYAGIRRSNVAYPFSLHVDPVFFYEIYALHPQERFVQPPVDMSAPGEIIFGGFARYVGHTLSDETLTADGEITLEIIWQSAARTDLDYTLFVHLIDADADPDGLAPYAFFDGPIARWEEGYYATTFWEPGEYLLDRRTIRLQRDTPPGDNYRIRVGFYVADGQRAPVTIDGQAAGDGYLPESPLRVAE
jgi:hypothetical protein